MISFFLSLPIPCDHRLGLEHRWTGKSPFIWKKQRHNSEVPKPYTLLTTAVPWDPAHNCHTQDWGQGTTMVALVPYSPTVLPGGHACRPPPGVEVSLIVWLVLILHSPEIKICSDQPTLPATQPLAPRTPLHASPGTPPSLPSVILQSHHELPPPHHWRFPAESEFSSLLQDHLFVQ